MRRLAALTILRLLLPLPHRLLPRHPPVSRVMQAERQDGAVCLADLQQRGLLHLLRGGSRRLQTGPMQPLQLLP